MNREKPATSRNVLVRTLPLSHANYGGALQAFALQRVIRSLGHSVTTDTSTARPPRRLAGDAAHAAVRLLRPSRRRAHRIHQLATRPLAVDFVNERLETTEIFGKLGRPRRSRLKGFDAFVVGSDQVWRPRYGDVESFLFDFLPNRTSATIVSYAASFGSDPTAEFSPALRHETRDLAREFDAIGVREQSAVAHVASLWGRDATWTLDPTLLLHPQDYEALQASARGPENSASLGEPPLALYVLDASPSLQEAARRYAEVNEVAVSELLKPVPTDWRTYREDPASHEMLAIGEWLSALHNASRVVTDSYHGTIFALRFHRPFATIINRTRGADRFESLLGALELTDHLLDPAYIGEDLESSLAAVLDKPVDWSAVDTKLGTLREDSLKFLRDALA